MAILSFLFLLLFSFSVALAVAAGFLSADDRIFKWSSISAVVFLFLLFCSLLLSI